MAARVVKSSGYIGSVANNTTNRLPVFRVVCLDRHITNEVFDMFALVIVAAFCYVAGGSGLALIFLAPADAGYPQPNGDAVIIVLAAGVFFHAMSKVLDYLKEIRDAVQKMADDK